MSVVYLILLSLIQGVTEFLPISSSAHLMIFPFLLKVSDQGIVVDIAAHIGSLFAVLFFYRNDIKNIIVSVFCKSADKSLFFKLVIATVPVVFVGGVFFFLDLDFRNPEIVIYTSIIFGILFYLSDLFARQNKTIADLTFRDAFFIGLMQTLSIIPGVSRSGITTTQGLFLGLKREEALRFSFLLSVPTVALAGLAGIVDFAKSEEVVNVSSLIITIVFSFVFSLLAIKFMMAWVRRATFKVFALYRVLLGIFLYLYLK